MPLSFWGGYALVGMDIVCFHATANISNDYFDMLYQVDQPDSPTVMWPFRVRLDISGKGFRSIAE
jgi:hypothetical protein